MADMPATEGGGVRDEAEMRLAQDLLFFAYRDFTNAADIILVELGLGRADVLLLLSDGLTELFNPADDMFGEERVEQCLQASAQSSPDEIIARLLAEAEVWAEGRKLDDDLTLVVLKAK